MNCVQYYEQPPSYEKFLHHHLIPNLPALIGPSLTAEWEATKSWVTVEQDKSDSNRSRRIPNYEHLRTIYGSCKVQVADCNDRYFTDQKRSEMTFDDFVDLWQKDTGKSRFYLKDWHFVQARPEIKAYEVPKIFEDDWLNGYWVGRKMADGSEDDYRFSYMGGDGTFTPFHADVYRSYSWSSNICGVKKWTLFRPGQEHLYKNKRGDLVYDIRNVDPLEFPDFERAERIVLYQKAGETLFVPSGWFHQVENLGPTISINHNWTNSTNVEKTFESLANDLVDVRHAIDNLEDEMSPLEFVEQCQDLLHVHSGWHWKLFIEIAQSAVDRAGEESRPGREFEYECLRRVIKKMEDNEPLLIKYFEYKSLDCLDQLKHTIKYGL
ncbi:hypothetical protein J3Q64DRAFT_1716994 [Phycomyces blakesleeanus]|uniref:JmjC domain-containing protein n=2 Tax=Phycomyces blakesleeanus TaxID=4837 RepID=A0A167QPH6_PHYB8|nr:hypothetical protein PHYBLDRAFT_140028 [Phycomyces blakesleeanus NRRL 1555(-)]OAD80018.1 hypothetical protein PHYBLDRAFT_140028 [Phycomyces blakesleeanus NRRL 1555(-)]|eukprot:XP_018298058.1 hypothetical protein PHYBLDRAFT_140028 [Phycomyces blakesleeanus NRRL 1555(-)]